MNQITMVDVSKLKAAPCNPECRTTERAVQQLMASIQVNGILQPITACRDGTIIDGHRRWTAGRALGMKEVPVVYVDVPSSEVARLWSELQRPTRQISSIEWFLYWGKVRSFKHVPKRIAESVKLCQQVFGKAGVEQMLKNAWPSGTVDSVVWLSNQFPRWGLTASDIAEWTLRVGRKSLHEACRAVDKKVLSPSDASRKIKACVRNGWEFSLAEKIPRRRAES